MSFRAFGSVFFAGLMAVIALSTGGRMYMLVALLLFIMFTLSAVSAAWAFLTLTVGVAVDGEDIPHGESKSLKITMRHNCPLPIAPIWVRIRAPEGDEGLRIPARPFNPHASMVRIFCPHVGSFQVGLAEIMVDDVFGLFSFRKRRPEWMIDTLVLPRVEPLDCPKFSPGESEIEVISRATEDSSSPSGVRGYQPGDELKKVHWKLSLRKREILVKTYDQPLRPDAVVLMDCVQPHKSKRLDADARDRMCDLAASMCSSLLSQGANVRMPLTGQPPEDVTLRRGDPLPPMLKALARMRFDGRTPFERTLAMESSKLRRSGATVCLTSGLTSEGADRIIRLRRLGPTVRVYLVCDDVNDAQRALIGRLRQNGVECVVEPQPGEPRRAEA